MPDQSPRPPSSSVRPALTAFLHGIEVRAWVFALSQCADPARAEQVLALALDGFVTRAKSLPLARWPSEFWSSLLAQPLLLTEASEQPGLAHLPPGPRAALLLRLIAGLDFVPAAQVLGVSPSAYEAALRQALAHPDLDDARMQALREHLHEQIHALPAAQRELLATLREQALAGLAEPAEQAPASSSDSISRFGGRRGLQWALLGALLLLLIVSFIWPHGLPTPRKGEVLPAELIAPPPALSDAVIVTHPDYQQLAQPDDDKLAAQLAFLSWLAAATTNAGAAKSAPNEASAPDSFDQLPPAEQTLLFSAQAAWPALDASTRGALARNARDWSSRPAAERQSLRLRLQQWDRQAPADRARRRTPFLAWQRLSPGDRERVRQAAARLAQLPPTEQQALREQFTAAPTDTQALWWMGPALGQELAPISSLFAFMPEADRPALLLALRSLDGQSRADLALLAPRLSESKRQALRRDLLQAPPEARAALIRQRLTQ